MLASLLQRVVLAVVLAGATLAAPARPGAYAHRPEPYRPKTTQESGSKYTPPTRIEVSRDPEQFKSELKSLLKRPADRKPIEALETGRLIEDSHSCCFFIRTRTGADDFYGRIETALLQNYFSQPYQPNAARFLVQPKDEGSRRILDQTGGLRGRKVADTVRSSRDLIAVLDEMRQREERELFVIGHREHDSIHLYYERSGRSFGTWSIPIVELHRLGAAHGLNIVVWACDSGAYVSGGFMQPFNMRPLLRAIDDSIGKAMAHGNPSASGATPELTVLDFFQAIVSGHSHHVLTMAFDGAALLASQGGAGARGEVVDRNAPQSVETIDLPGVHGVDWAKLTQDAAGKTVVESPGQSFSWGDRIQMGLLLALGLFLFSLPVIGIIYSLVRDDEEDARASAQPRSSGEHARTAAGNLRVDPRVNPQVNPRVSWNIPPDLGKRRDE